MRNNKTQKERAKGTKTEDRKGKKRGYENPT